MGFFVITSGDAYLEDRRLTVTVRDSAQAVVDLTDMDMTFLVAHPTTEVAVIVKTTVDAEIEIATPQTGDTKGKAYIELDPADTEDLRGRYVWELEVTDAVGPATLAGGGLYIKHDLIAEGS